MDVRDGTYAMEHRTEGGRCGHSPFPFSIYLSSPLLSISLSPSKPKLHLLLLVRSFGSGGYARGVLGMELHRLGVGGE